jgi:hypothetical protein
LSDPAPHAGTVKRDAVASGDCRLSIQRLVVCVFRDEDIREQTRVGDAPLDWQSRHRRLFDGVAARANEFAPDRANDFEGGRNSGELFGYVLTEQLHCLTAVRATGFRLEHMSFAQEVRR